MIGRAVAISLLAHLALLGVIAWRWSSRASEPALRISAPLGDVFAGAKPEMDAGAKPEMDAGAKPERDTGEKPLAAEPATPAAAQPAPSDLAGEVSAHSAGVASGEAQPVGEIRPAYPAMSRKLGEEGEATFLLKIAADGRVENAELLQSSGHPRLDEAARAALQGARFVSDGQSAAKRFRVEFRLR